MVGNIVNSQKEDPGVKSTCRADAPLFEACMLSSCLGYPRLLQLPPTVRRRVLG